MKSRINIIITFLVVVITHQNLKGQSSYVVTNLSSSWINVTLDIAYDPVVCNLYPGITTRSVSGIVLKPGGCGSDIYNASLNPYEWVYKITILEYSGCSSDCSAMPGSPYFGTTVQPCPTSPATSGWTYCSVSHSAVADNTSYCNIY